MKTIQIRCDSAMKLDIDDLVPFQDGLKDLDKKEYEKLKKEILETGFAFPFNVWKSGDQWKLISGHQRHRVLKTMRSMGYEIPPLPCAQIQAKDEAEAKRRILQDASSYGKVNSDGLEEFLHNANFSLEFAADSFRLPDVNLDRMFEASAEFGTQGLTDPDEIPEVKETRAKPGDIWILGDHRLVVGDSTSVNDVDKLFGSERAEMCFTSPPYNLGNNAKLRGYNGDGDDSAYLDKSDHKTSEEYLQFLKDFTALCISKCDISFINIQLLAGNKFIMSDYWGHFKNNLVDLMIWDKEHAQPSAAQRVLNSVFEFIFIFANAEFPTRAIKTGKNFRGTIQNIYRLNPIGKKDPLAKDHGAVFPVQFAEFFVDQFSDKSVYDPFGGSGTTVIACEKTGRKCFTMELNHTYASVIIKRWENFTGKSAQLVS